MAKKQGEYELYLKSLSREDREKLDCLMSSLDTYCVLGKKDIKAFRKDFQNAVLWYASKGVDTDTAVRYLNPVNFGGFFARKSLLWFPLDDAAKVYPLSMKTDFMAVFRLSCIFKEDVVPQILQIALNFTVKRFPHFATTLKKGVFWHYLNASKHRYTIEKENSIPCSPIRLERTGSQTFRVLYWKNRMSVEFFHVLTDGTGGMRFLKSLAAEYLRLKELLEDDEEYEYLNSFPVKEESENGFERYLKKVPASGFMDRMAVQMNGKLSNGPSRIVHFRMDTQSLLEAAHRHNATVSAFLLALMFMAGRSATDAMSGEHAVQVPVNMRKYHPSRTLSNFSMYFMVREELDNIKDIDSLIADINRQMREKGTEENMDRMVASAARFVRMARYVPMVIKQPVAKQIYGFLGDKLFSNTFSNLGNVELPAQYARYIDSMDFVLGTGITNRAACSLVTYNNVSVFSVTKYTADPTFEESMNRLLKTENVRFTVEGSRIWK